MISTDKRKTSRKMNRKIIPRIDTITSAAVTLFASTSAPALAQYAFTKLVNFQPRRIPLVKTSIVRFWIGLVLIAAIGSSWRCAAAGVPIAGFSFGGADFVENDSQQFVYVSSPLSNAVEVINANTLALVQTISLNSSPDGIALSANGSSLYVCLPSSNSIAIINTQSFETTSTLASPSTSPTDVQIGTDNRLWVQDSTGIQQIDATTGISTGPNVPVFVYSGIILTSPDGNSLYYSQYDLLNSSLYKFNVSGTQPKEVWTNEYGENGGDLELSDDGSLLARPSGNPYNMGIYNTSSGAIIGSVGGSSSYYVDQFAFSPDDEYGYADGGGGITSYSLSTFTAAGVIGSGYSSERLFVDSSGQYLFDGLEQGLAVYDTGRSVPEPATVFLLLIASVSLFMRRRRKQLA